MENRGARKKATVFIATALILLPVFVHAEVVMEVAEEPKEKVVEVEGKTATKELEKEEYIIGKDDLLEISVWGYEELTREVTVRPDGRISFPLIGDVEAEGLTTSQLKKKITDELAVYVREPKVTVIVKEFGGKVVVLGQVRSAGVYGIKGRFSLAEAIARAGGLTESAVSRSIVVIQGGLENPNISLVNLNKAMYKGGFTLRSGDVVYVPRSFIGNINYVLRQIIPSLSTVYYIDQLAE